MKIPVSGSSFEMNAAYRYNIPIDMLAKITTSATDELADGGIRDLKPNSLNNWSTSP
jgi:hypothetical protein